MELVSREESSVSNEGKQSAVKLVLKLKMKFAVSECSRHHLLHLATACDSSQLDLAGSPIVCLLIQQILEGLQ